MSFLRMLGMVFGITPKPKPYTTSTGTVLGGKVWERVFVYPDIFACVNRTMLIESSHRANKWLWGELSTVKYQGGPAYSGTAVLVGIYVCIETGEVYDQLDEVQEFFDKRMKREEEIAAEREAAVNFHVNQHKLATAIWKDCRGLYKEV